MPDPTIELSEHDKRMIAVADGGDPADPAENLNPENPDVRLPSDGELPLDQMNPEDMSKEQLLEFIKGHSADAEDGDDAEDGGDDEDEDSDDELGGEDEDGDEAPTEAEKKLAAAEDKLREASAYEAAGGKEGYQDLAKWGAENLGEEQIEIFNQAVTTGEPDVVKFAVEALKAFQKVQSFDTFGQEGDMTLGNNGGVTPSVTGYESQAQMSADMSDPRYKIDPAFQERVAMKLSVTTAF